MSIVSFNVQAPMLQGVAPRTVQLVTTDSLATITTAGYMNGQGQVLQGENLSPTDVMNVIYSYNVTTNSGSFGIFVPSIASNGTITLVQWANPGDVLLPVVSGDFAVFNGTTGQIKDAGYLPSNAAKTVVSMVGSAVVANHIALFQDTTGTIDDTAATALNNGPIQAGASGTAGSFISFPGTAANGSFKFAAVNNSANHIMSVSNAASVGQDTVVSVPDPGAATANFVLDAGNASSLSVLNLKYGATPVAQVDPGSCTITAAAGAANTANVTIQLKDGSGTNIARSVGFRVYASSAADGLTLASAASTGFSVSSGGLSLANGTAVTTQISAMSSATGGCVLALLDTGKQTSYLVLVLPSGNKISAQLSAGSYG